MKKYISLLLALTVVGLASCGNDDDKPEIEQPNMLSKVTCVKNNASSPKFVLTITYNQDRQIANIVTDSKSTDVYTYTTNSVIANCFTSDGSASPVLSKKMQYQLSGGGVIKSEEYLQNSYKNNEEYLANVYSFSYNRNNLMGSSWDQATWPKTDGTGYESRQTMETYNYTWTDGNVSLLKSGTKEMAFTYKSDLQPETLPLRLLNTFDPVAADAVSPFNFFFGNRNRNLIETARVYVLPNVDTLLAKYTFSYNSTGGYITGMTLTEEIFPVDGATAATNTYTYSFEYNYR